MYSTLETEKANDRTLYQKTLVYTFMVLLCDSAIFPVPYRPIERKILNDDVSFCLSILIDEDVDGQLPVHRQDDEEKPRISVGRLRSDSFSVPKGSVTAVLLTSTTDT